MFVYVDLYLPVINLTLAVAYERSLFNYHINGELIKLSHYRERI